MGKLYSKPAAVSKARESPEGDSLVVSACLARKGIEDWLSRQKDGCSTATQHKEIGSLPSKGPPGENQAAVVGEELYRLEVALPPEKPESGLKEEKKHEKEAPLVYRKQLRFEGLECDMSLEENNRPEWTFTLYDFDNNGKVTREDITSLLHTIYEVVGASVNHSPHTSKTLQVKLTVSPDATQKRKSTSQNLTDAPISRRKMDCKTESRSSGKKLRAPLRCRLGDYHAQEGCCQHAIDENLERRNHYLDLAGIENYMSQAGLGAKLENLKPDSLLQAVSQAKSRTHESENMHRRPQKAEAVLDTSFMQVQDNSRHPTRSPKGQGKSAGRAVRNKVSSLGTGAPQLGFPNHILSSAHVQASPDPYRRHRQRGKDTKNNAYPVSALEKDQGRYLPPVLPHMLHPILLCDGSVGQMIQRHEHYHHHEHHHHYHHFQQA
ncbi:protein naked cuticle homolog 1 [Polypterus senegalus]|uniref:protein naked cuticle homolog 1 n=1 Tax=Polypterus senegalus TaxID=55291 RepID=UPI001963E495|nr:protein naked cuticle homolog 1 [Polypterus senegalus]